MEYLGWGAQELRTHLKMGQASQVLVAHACNPSYSGGRYHEDCVSKLALGKLFLRPCLKKILHEKRG
jgi:hypothetical protein